MGSRIRVYNSQLTFKSLLLTINSLIFTVYSLQLPEIDAKSFRPRRLEQRTDEHRADRV